MMRLNNNNHDPITRSQPWPQTVPEYHVAKKIYPLILTINHQHDFDVIIHLLRAPPSMLIATLLEHSLFDEARNYAKDNGLESENITVQEVLALVAQYPSRQNSRTHE